MRIDQIKIQDMWSFGRNGSELSALPQHTVLIGKNNTGKSKILAALDWTKKSTDQIAHGEPFPIDPALLHEINADSANALPEVHVFVQLDEPLREKLVKSCEISNSPLSKGIDEFTRGKLHFGARRIAGVPDLKMKPFFSFEGGGGIDFAKFVGNGGYPNAPAAQAQWNQQHVPNIRGRFIKEITQRIKYISGWRSLDEPVIAGESLIKCLHKWQNPTQQEKPSRHLFTKTQNLFRELMLDQDLEIRPEHNGEKLSIQSTHRYVPVEACGDGVQQLLMLAFHLTTAPDGILLIEEPEIHLHPELQRKLMQVLKRECKGQSIITTHSPVLLDSGTELGVYRVEHDRSHTTVHQCCTTRDMCYVLDLLDVRASDILQANIVIWVEGPTDRLFLKKCFELREEKLQEGLHYQIAYYGGSLRSHLTFDDSLSHLVNLLKLSRHVAMVCDSDKKKEDGELGEAKTRLQKECDNQEGFYWVTVGREIENYFPDEVLTAAYKELLGDSAKPVVLGKFEKLDEVLFQLFPDPKRGDGWKVRYESNKAQVMPYLLKHLKRDHLQTHGLMESLDALVKRIRQANPDLSPVTG